MQPTPRPPSAPNPASLLIEDDKEHAELVAVAPETQGFPRWNAAEDASRGRPWRIADRSPDLILLDLMLPKVDGSGRLQRLRRDGRSARDADPDADRPGGTKGQW